MRMTGSVQYSHPPDHFTDGLTLTASIHSYEPAKSVRYADDIFDTGETL